MVSALIYSGARVYHEEISTARQEAGAHVAVESFAAQRLGAPHARARQTRGARERKRLGEKENAQEWQVWCVRASVVCQSGRPHKARRKRACCGVQRYSWDGQWARSRIFLR